MFHAAALALGDVSRGVSRAVGGGQENGNGARTGAIMASAKLQRPERLEPSGRKASL
jgi:hypothetical protein